MQYIQKSIYQQRASRIPFECISTAGMAAHNICRSANLVQCAFYHLVGYGICKKYQKIRTSYLFSEVGFHLCEDFAFTFIRFTDFFVLPYHSVMSAYDYNTHVLSSFCSFRYINMGIGKYLSLA